MRSVQGVLSFLFLFNRQCLWENILCFNWFSWGSCDSRDETFVD